MQAGTSHFLGQNFAKAFDVQFVTKDNKKEFVWATSWGVSTRLMGALIMSHSDDNGLVLPPKLAPIQVVIVPIYRTDEGLAKISEVVLKLKTNLQSKGISVKYDDSDTRKPGWKFAEHELKGVPVRIGIGERDLENGTIELARRDTLTKETVAIEGIETVIENLLNDIQNNLFNRAKERQTQSTYLVDTYADFKTTLDEKPGFILAHWDGTSETEQKIKEETKATIRCIPFDLSEESGICIYSGKPSNKRVLFAVAY